jgi:hypothetical protein
VSAVYNRASLNHHLEAMNPCLILLDLGLDRMTDWIS